jgi:DNA-binding NarL/FixJ family response regulator
MSNAVATVVLADDHPLVLQGLRALLDEQEDFQIVAACGSGEQALDAIRVHHPDIAVVDVTMPGVNGLAVLGTVVDERLTTRVVLLTASVTDSQILEAVTAGVHGLVLKESAPEMLVKCLRGVAAGRRWLPQEIIKPALDRELQRREEGRRFVRELTAREIDIIRLIADGLSNKAIASRLTISEGTVKIHLHHIYQKLGISNRAALAALAIVQRDQLG